MLRWTVVALALVACKPKFEPEVAVQHGDVAFLSVARQGDNTWVAGAQPGPQQSGTLLLHDGEAWSSVETGTPHVLWWVHPFDSSVFVGGAGATVLRVTATGEVERLPTPAFFGNTVFGVWGTSEDDVWAVGGWAARAGFAWHWDGQVWTDVPLPDDMPRTRSGDIPALFKVWGRSSDDVWIVGGSGTMLHWNGAVLERVVVDTDETLFTVTGDDQEVVAVGGDVTGKVLRGGEDGFDIEEPPGAPLLQAVSYDGRGDLWVAGEGGYAARSNGRSWKTETLPFDSPPQSIHAIAGAERGIWAAGGRVLSPSLDVGVVLAPVESGSWEPPEIEPPDVSCPADQVNPYADRTIARRWNEQLLGSIRRDIPHPPKHARNLWHASVVMWDVLAAYDDGPMQPIVFDEDLSALDSVEAREEALSYAMYGLLSARYADAIGNETSLDCYDRFMEELGYDPTDDHTDGDDPVAVGNRVAAAVLERFADDGSNEANQLEDTTGWEPANPVMIVDRPGTNVEDPDIWQQLNLGTAETQNGIVLDSSVQPYIAPHWRDVEPYAITADPETGLYSTFEAGLPTVEDAELGAQVLEVIRKTAELSIDDGVMIEIGPSGRGNNTLGFDDGEGYDANPVTGEPYPENRVPRGDFSRVVAEMWADGPTSETPPGHWTKLANEVTDQLGPDDLRPFGGERVDPLTWDVGLYLVVGGAVHDGAISAWELKRESLGPRPITLVRWMAAQGQRTEPDADDFDPRGLPLEAGLVERITEESASVGERHHHLRWYIGELAIRSWPGEPGDRESDYTPLVWMRAADWIPYQRRTFVTPAFPGFTSGHSTFSRAAAEALAGYTGSPWFPGGVHSFTAEQNDYLVFEQGPSVAVRLEWASYFDAADQAGQSRLWGGIHVFADDTAGRINGSRVGLASVERTRALWGLGE